MGWWRIPSTSTMTTPPPLRGGPLCVVLLSAPALGHLGTHLAHLWGDLSSQETYLDSYVLSSREVHPSLDGPGEAARAWRSAGLE
mmetsp:Transcript_15855/g.63907  ORF Transcript_15855/g.63907 Transcript_15855/m.63907 type:complete len:85 (+) Transcript_15855:2074-2328(+)